MHAYKLKTCFMESSDLQFIVGRWLNESSQCTAVTKSANEFFECTSKEVVKRSKEVFA